MAVADALSALDPRCGSPRWAPQRGLETRLVPERGYHLRADHAGAAAAQAHRRPGPAAGAGAPRGPGDPRGARRRRRRRGRRLRRLRRAARLPGRPPAAPRAGGDPRGQRQRRHRPTRSGARSARRVLSAVPDSGLPRRRGRRHTGARGHHRRWTGRRCGQRPGRTSVSPTTRRCCWCSAGRRARSRSTGRCRPPPPSWPQPVSRCCTRTAPRTRSSCADPADGDPPYVAVPYLDRMDLAYAAADLAICRSGAMTVAEVSAVGLPAVYVPLPIGNGEQRLNALPVVDAGGGLIVDDADLTPGFVAEHRGRAAHRRAPAHGDDGRRGAGRPPRRRPAGGRGRPRGGTQARRGESRKRRPVSARRCREELQRVHMVGIGGAGMSGIARILLDRGGLVSGSDAKESRGVRRCAPAARRSGSDTTRRRWTCCPAVRPRSSPLTPRSRRPTPNWSRRGGAASR